MPTYTDALRGYAAKILARDNYTCRYCGLDGRQSFSNWLTLSEDHLLPKGHPKRNDAAFRVACCQFCNVAGNRYLDQAAANGVNFEDKTPEELVALRLPVVQKTRDAYRQFWEESVRQSGNAAEAPSSTSS
ncbi:MAG: HNH endonuclease [Burkholderiales bacterium]|nr:HNH endonuclease [Burkholderiales bacterium]